MVVWLIRGFFLLLAAGVLAWLADALYQRTRPVRQLEAAVERKWWTAFPRTVVWVRRDRRDCQIAFRLPEGEELILPVPEDVYDALEKGESGVLTCQGSRFRRFLRPDGTEVRHTPLARPDGGS